MNLHPTEDRVVIRPLPTDDKTPGGIVLPDNAKEKPVRGDVVAAGLGKPMDVKPLLVKISDNTFAHADHASHMAIKVGDRVLYGRYSGTEFEHEGEDLVIMRASDVLAVIKP